MPNPHHQLGSDRRARLQGVDEADSIDYKTEPASKRTYDTAPDGGRRYQSAVFGTDVVLLGDDRNGALVVNVRPKLGGSHLVYRDDYFVAPVAIIADTGRDART